MPCLPFPPFPTPTLPAGFSLPSLPTPSIPVPQACCQLPTPPIPPIPIPLPPGSIAALTAPINAAMTIFRDYVNQLPPKCPSE